MFTIEWVFQHRRPFRSVLVMVFQSPTSVVFMAFQPPAVPSRSNLGSCSNKFRFQLTSVHDDFVLLVVKRQCLSGFPLILVLVQVLPYIGELNKREGLLCLFDDDARKAAAQSSLGEFNVDCDDEMDGILLLQHEVIAVL